MTTVLQIILVLVLIAMVAIILGYLIGKISCKRDESSRIIEKGVICEESYNQQLIENNKNNDLVQNIEKENSSNDSSVKLEDKEQTLASETKKEELQTTKNETDSSDTLKQSSKVSNAQALISETNKNRDKSEDDLKAKNKQNSTKENSDNETSAKNSDDKVNDKDESSSKDTTSTKPQALLSETSQETKDSNNTGQIKPQMLKEPIDGKADNLCRIKGIGVVIDKKLKELGVFHFWQIAKWSENEIAWVDEQLAFKGRIAREKWIDQAKLLAEGKETEFSKRVDKGEVESSKKS